MVNHLHKKLGSLQLIMLSLGGTLGTGIFFSSNYGIEQTGSSIILVYLLGGAVIYIIMQALLYMSVDYPSSGSFVEYTYQYLGNPIGFIIGWNTFIVFTLICFFQLSVISSLITQITNVPQYMIYLTVLALVGLINLLEIQKIATIQTILTIIKLVIVFIIIIKSSIYLWEYLYSHNFNVNECFLKNKQLNNYFSHGIHGFVNASICVSISFVGLEYISIAGGETIKPIRTIKKAFAFVFTIFMFMITLISANILFYPVSQGGYGTPCLTLINSLKITHINSILSFIAFSTAISSLYATSRIILTLSKNSGINRICARINKNGTPRNAIFISLLFLLGLFGLHLFFKSSTILLNTLACASVGIIINWVTILFSYLVITKQIYHSSINNGYSNYKIKVLKIGVIIALIYLFILFCSVLIHPISEFNVCIVLGWILIFCVILAFKKTNHQNL